MDRNQLKQKIQDSVVQTALNIARNRKKNAPELSEEEVDRIVFNGNDFEGIHKKFSLYESLDSAPQVTQSEIDQFENDMEALVAQIPNSTLSFDTQENGHFIYAAINERGPEALASGHIQFASGGNVKWFFSLQEGCRVLTEDALKLTEDNKNIFTALYDFYATWQNAWRNSLNQSS